MPPCLAPAHWWWRRASALLLCWELQLGAYSVGCCCCCCFPSKLCCPLRFQDSPQTCWWKGFLVFGNFSSFTTPSLGWVSIPNSFVSLFVFCVLSYLLLKRMGWVPGVLLQHSQVVLWKLLRLQMIFWWICGGENGLPLLFLCHLRITELILFLFLACLHWLQDLSSLTRDWTHASALKMYRVLKTGVPKNS